MLFSMERKLYVTGYEPQMIRSVRFASKAAQKKKAIRESNGLPMKLLAPAVRAWREDHAHEVAICFLTAAHCAAAAHRVVVEQLDGSTEAAPISEHFAPASEQLHVANSADPAWRFSGHWYG